jgi:outer membrane protein
MPNFKTQIARIAVASALAVAWGGGVANAQKVAILDMQKAVLATSDGKKAAQNIDAKFAPVKADLDRLQKDLVARQDQFTKGRAAMSATAITAAQAEIETLRTTLARKNEDAQQDLREEENKELGGIIPKLQQVINAYAAANQISVVVDTSASPNNLVYAEGSINITPAVVAAYEKAAGSPAAAPGVPPAATTPKAPAPTQAPKTTAPVH